MKNNSLSKIKELTLIELNNSELSNIYGGEPSDHVGYWVSAALGPPAHQVWLAGYWMGRYT